MSTNSERVLAGDVTFRICRTFTAAPERVWAAWTRAEQVIQWWGPEGFSVSHLELDLKVGGRCHYGLKQPDGGTLWGRMDFERIEPPRLLAFNSLFSDAQGAGPTRHPWEPDWPLNMLTEITFNPVDSGTELIIRWTPVDAMPVEISRFERGHGECHDGWTGTLDKLEEFLKSYKENNS